MPAQCCTRESKGARERREEGGTERPATHLWWWTGLLRSRRIGHTSDTVPLPNRQRRMGGPGPLRSRAVPVDFKPTGFTAVTKQQRTTTLFRPGSNTSPPSDLQLALRASPVSAGPTSYNPDTAGSTSHNPDTAGSTSHISPSTLAIGPNAEHASAGAWAGG